jgi:hypothetical protein
VTTHTGFVVNVVAKDAKTAITQVGNLKND